MSRPLLSDFFDGAAAKHLRSVDLDPTRSDAGANASHQHEIGGLPSAGAKEWLGIPTGGDKYRFPCNWLLIDDKNEKSEFFESDATWYDTRWEQPRRSPEYRLFYRSNPVTRSMQEGDFFLIAKHRNGKLYVFVAPPQSTIEMQLRALFGLESVSDRFSPAHFGLSDIPLPLRLLLDELGVELDKPERDDGFWLEKIVATFGDARFPSTAEFSGFARNSLTDLPSPLEEPDLCLMNWMDHEERLFRLLERKLLKDRLRQGFGQDGENVDDFINFSLSVQNRRKSRVGLAFESHLGHLFRLHGLRFQKGGKNKVTENNARPDFLFPSFEAYHDTNFPLNRLFLLGAKTTCKDRWRQVLSEGGRVRLKHLATLEAAISPNQTDEMHAHGLQLVIPASLHLTYTAAQMTHLLSLDEFVGLVRESQQADRSS